MGEGGKMKEQKWNGKMRNMSEGKRRKQERESKMRWVYKKWETSAKEVWEMKKLWKIYIGKMER